jgi:hypothetical protein
VRRTVQFRSITPFDDGSVPSSSPQLNGGSPSSPPCLDGALIDFKRSKDGVIRSGALWFTVRPGIFFPFDDGTASSEWPFNQIGELLGMGVIAGLPHKADEGKFSILSAHHEHGGRDSNTRY